jgi:sterol desaturase/sphingolipid hydroxylase (fatty acid hydroxylase superfamily)
MELELSFAQIGHLLSGHGNRVLVAMLPLVILAILAEMVVVQVRSRDYPWKGSAVSAAIAVGHAIAQAVTNGLVIGVIAAAAYHFRLFTIPIDRHTWPALIGLFLLADLAFYVEHRCSHRIRFMWASHSVHHSVDRLVFTAAFRLSWTPIVSGVFLFYLPIVWLGFPPAWVFGMASASLTYQIFVHTEIVPRIGWLDWVLNNPSAHRVHHASNQQYLDKNYGAVLMIWDHLFGTYQAELPTIVTTFGLTHPRSNNNPFTIAYEEFWNMFRDALRSQRWAYLIKPPGWQPPVQRSEV